METSFWCCSDKYRIMFLQVCSTELQTHELLCIKNVLCPRVRSLKSPAKWCPLYHIHLLGETWALCQLYHIPNLLKTSETCPHLLFIFYVALINTAQLVFHDQFLVKHWWWKKRTLRGRTYMKGDPQKAPDHGCPKGHMLIGKKIVRRHDAGDRLNWPGGGRKTGKES